MKNEDKPNFPMDKNDEIQSSSKKRKEHPVDMLANKTKTELLAEAHSAGIKGSSACGTCIGVQLFTGRPCTRD
jgi:hypothetical protein